MSASILASGLSSKTSMETLFRFLNNLPNSSYGSSDNSFVLSLEKPSITKQLLLCVD